MIITFLGTGTSHGIPVIGCDCDCCTSSDTRNQRFRTSIVVESSDGKQVLVDTSPEFRLQAIKYKIKKPKCVLLTHSHADHLHGLDDLRIFAHTFTPCSSNNPEKIKPLKIFANKNTVKDVKSRFSYVFKKTQLGGGKPLLKLIPCEEFSEKNPLKIGNLEIIPIPMYHGKLKVSGWMFKDKNTKNSFAYLTDCSFIPESSLELVKNCTYIVLDALREKIHTTHFNFEQAMEFVSKTESKEIASKEKGNRLYFDESKMARFDQLNLSEFWLISRADVATPPAFAALPGINNIPFSRIKSVASLVVGIFAPSAITLHPFAANVFTPSKSNSFCVAHGR